MNALQNFGRIDTEHAQDNYKDRATIWRSSIAQHIREIVAACGGSDSFSGAKYLTNLGVEIRIFKDSCDPHSPDKRAIPAGISSVNQPSKSRQHPWEGVTTTVTATGPSDTPTLPAYDAGSRTPTRGENIIYACNYQAKIKDLSTLRAIQSLWKLEPNGDKKINTLSTPYWNETLFCKDGIRGEAYWDGGDIGQAYSESSNPLSDYAKWIDEIVEACASPSFQPFSGRKYFTTSGHSFGMYADPSCTDSVVQVPKRDVSSVQELPAHNEVGRDAGSALVAGTGSPPTTLDTVVLDATSPPAPGSDNGRLQNFVLINQPPC